MPHYRKLIGFAAAVALTGCASDPFYKIKYPAESYTLDGKVRILATKKCKEGRQDCPVEVIPTMDPKADWVPEVISADASNKWIQWLIKDPDAWTFADPGIEFKDKAGKAEFHCTHTRFLVECKNTGKKGAYEYKIRVLLNGAGSPIETDPWVFNR